MNLRHHIERGDIKIEKETLSLQNPYVIGKCIRDAKLELALWLLDQEPEIMFEAVATGIRNACTGLGQQDQDIANLMQKVDTFVMPGTNDIAAMRLWLFGSHTKQIPINSAIHASLMPSCANVPLCASVVNTERINLLKE